MFRANDPISLQILDCCQWVEDYDDLSCLGLAAGEGPLGQDTEDVTDIALSCHHQVHWWIMWIFMVTRQWQCVIVSSAQLWRVCTLRRLEESAAGQDQNTGEGRHYQWLGHTPSSLRQIRSYDWLTVDGVRTEEASSVGRTKQFVCSILYSTSCNK